MRIDFDPKKDEAIRKKHDVSVVLRIVSLRGGRGWHVRMNDALDSRRGGT